MLSDTGSSRTDRAALRTRTSRAVPSVTSATVSVEACRVEFVRRAAVAQACILRSRFARADIASASSTIACGLRDRVQDALRELGRSLVELTATGVLRRARRLGLGGEGADAPARREDERGVAAHWAYKAGGGQSNAAQSRAREWVDARSRLIEN